MNRTLQLLTVLPLLATGLFCVPRLSSGQAANSSPSTMTVAAFVWPAYHPDDRAKIFWPDGIGEWQTVMSNKPKFEGHEQPRYPLWGYINEADPYVAEMEIAAAADHGINLFIFDWYWYDGLPFLEGHLDDGYLKARNNNRVKFYLMWANHDVNLGWDKRNADDAFNEKNTAQIWKGGVDRMQFEKIVHRFIDKYFTRPSYYEIDGKPVFMVYDLRNLLGGLGGIEKTRQALSWFRAEVKKAGFAGLELQLSMRDENAPDVSWKEGGKTYAQRELVQALGFDSLTHYQFVHFIPDVNRDYNAIVKDAVAQWDFISKSYAAKYYPHVSVGWDASPRTYRYVGAVVKNNTPENFEKALRQAKAFVGAHPDRAPLITINSWNEWTETSYLQPCSLYGYGYLDAVKHVFVDGK